ncbi:TetR/AcrR family transcriptional regulator [Microbacterium sp. MRS-1]|uniref:TetR/AcrR family transcriptional regulator n=1 Tax=Microbacterium sp. MRS-1 TaxID=1451261 RepID=UPI00044813B3|nr:TetR family transcriptional regulator [Microbacterium sp. MRS-1]EXJ52126.1 transcriptional regulator [Microbacterium sp. MRS-1]
MTTTAPLRRPRKDAAANRAGILRAAATTLAVDPSASIDQIARAAGLSRRALYGHFDDRRALLTELIAAGAQRFNAIAASLDEPHPPLALARLTAALWTEAAHVQVAAALALQEGHLEQTATALAPLRRALVAVVRAGQDDGTLRVDMAAPTLARLIEETARAAVSRIDASSPIATSLAVRAVLSIAGLSWRESEALLNAHPDVLETK